MGHQMADIDRATDIAKHMNMVATAVGGSAPPSAQQIRWALREGVAEIAELRAMIKEHVPEKTARQLLRFAAAAAIFGNAGE